MSVFIAKKAGKLRNGAERGKGSVYHMIETSYPSLIDEPALCGARPRLQWSAVDREKQWITCPKCLKIQEVLEDQCHS